MPAPSRNAATFVVHTPRMRIIVISISGSRLRISTMTQARQISAPTPIRAIVFGNPQPHVIVSLTAIRITDMPTLINAAASQLTRPGTRTGDSGTNRQVHTADTTITISGNQYSQ